MKSVLTPVEITERAPTLPSGQMQTWAAVSRDGLWTYTREEVAGTPWIVVYTPTGQQMVFTSLPRARRWTASGQALPLLRRRAQAVIDRQGRWHLEGGVPVDVTEQACQQRIEQARQVVDILQAQIASQAAA